MGQSRRSEGPLGWRGESSRKVLELVAGGCVERVMEAEGSVVSASLEARQAGEMEAEPQASV